MSVTIDYSGRVALVTGAAQGIGAATAAAFARAGAHVMLSDLNPAVENTAAALTEEGYSATHCVSDVADDSSCADMVAQTMAAFGRLDFAFNNAGVGSFLQPVDEVELTDWNRVINVNLNGVFLCCRHQVPAMMENGGGVIVNNSSILGTRALPGTSLSYTAAKHGVIGFTRQMAVNHGGDGIRCVAVCPGLIETTLVALDPEAGPKLGGLDEEARQAIIQRTSLGRTGEPSDIAGAVLTLCSPENSFVNGQYLVVDGGLQQG